MNPKIVTVSSVGGGVLWGPAELDGSTTIGTLINLVAQIEDKWDCVLRLLDGSRCLDSKETLDSAGLPAVVDLVVTFCPTRWPVPLLVMKRLVEPQLTVFLERPPLWQQLSAAPPKALRSFAKSLLRGLPEDDTQRASFFLRSLNIDVLSSTLPEDFARRMAEVPCDEEHVASLVADFVRFVCKNKFIDAPERRLVQWPSKADARRAVALLVMSRVYELRDAALRDSPLQPRDVDEATAALFKGTPDFPLIRRYLLEAKFLTQKDLVAGVSPSDLWINAEEVQRAIDALMH
eukprot:TRINITY_DN19960_c0_g2_i1.p1 TRINITY_DN19960_c0_g2~~TRINITY_DN19960_c0_g2_i1.p1  ORF type:complete len:291 (+),score=51.23 TRINITY_DN19960_c0_g2_i1:79-951(+)